MRNSENFTAIFVMGGSTGPYVGLSYVSLPLHYVAIYDAIEKGKIALSTNEIIQGKFIFVNHLNIYVELSANNQKVYGDLLFPEENVVIEFILSETDRHLAATLSQYSKSHHVSSLNTLSASQYVESTLDVPKYGQWRLAGCAPLACTMVLAYHYWINYDEYWRLLDDVYTQRELYREGDIVNGIYINGWKGLDTELGEAMGYVEGKGTSAANSDDGIEEVCNDSDYDNYYNFQANYESGGTQLDQFIKLQDEIDQGLPVVTHFSANSTLIRFNEDTTRTTEYDFEGGHSVADIGYRYEPGWESDAAKRWHICNWGENTTEDPWYVCDATRTSMPMYTTVTPGPHQGISGTIENSVTLIPGVWFAEDNVFVDQGGVLTIADGAILFLNFESKNNYVKSIGGEIVLDGEVDPDFRVLTNSGTLVGLYSTFQQAYDNAVPISGEIIVNCEWELENNTCIPSGVTLTLDEAAVVSLQNGPNSYFIESSGGVIVIDGNVAPDIRLKDNSGNLIGLYSTFQQAYNQAQPDYRIEARSSLELTTDYDLTNINAQFYGQVKIKNGAQVTLSDATYYIKSKIDVMENSTCTITGSTTVLELANMSNVYIRESDSGGLTCAESIAVLPFKLYS